MAKHSTLLENLASDFLKKRLLNRDHLDVLLVAMYVLLFVLNRSNYKLTFQSLLRARIPFMIDLLEEFCSTEYHFLICQTACKWFEDDYVLEKILAPLIDNKNIIDAFLNKYKRVAETVRKKPLTIPDEFVGLTMHTRKPPPPPSNTPTYHDRFKAAKPPKSTWIRNTTTETKIQRSAEINKFRANRLLKEAQKMPQRLIRPRSSKLKKQEIIYSIPLKRKPILIPQDVKVPYNTAVTLREASRLLKEKEREFKTLENLLKGGCDNQMLEKIDEEFRQEEYQRTIDAIERNHLKGLLSHESAVLARKNFVLRNKEKYKLFQQEKEQNMEALNKWKEEERIKIEKLVRKSQHIKNCARESEKKILEKKQIQVRLQQCETKVLLDKAYAEKMKELENKMQLIREIKALQQVRRCIKQFDPTECVSLGLLCEMSIAELRERLAITRLNVKREVEEKRKEILQRKEDKRRKLEDIENFILRSKATSKATPIAKTILSYKPSSEIDNLKRELEEKRKYREYLLAKE
ncbi:cilia- and flagella-associated protein 99-like [Cylas formicarius]|uniref:cilia- and flagella-associated protein 99-like n=1 Tax=Cylas formicarius TaxID=197179 RepID=UPI002958777F|nr:cilia- and flagella-associated protein 99-like [Cylas formicarius]